MTLYVYSLAYLKNNDEYYKKLKIVSYVIYIICSLIALLFPIKTEAGFATGRSVGFVYVVSTLCMMIWLIPIIKNFKSNDLQMAIIVL